MNNEKFDEYKKLIEFYENNSNYINISNNEEILVINDLLIERFNKNIKSNFMLFIQPIKNNIYSINYGKLETNVIVKINKNKNHVDKVNLYILYDGKEKKIKHKYTGHGGIISYTWFNLLDKPEYYDINIDLYVDISEKELNNGIQKKIKEDKWYAMHHKIKNGEYKK